MPRGIQRRNMQRRKMERPVAQPVETGQQAASGQDAGYHRLTSGSEYGAAAENEDDRAVQRNEHTERRLDFGDEVLRESDQARPDQGAGNEISGKAGERPLTVLRL